MPPLRAAPAELSRSGKVASLKQPFAVPREVRVEVADDAD
jgi:hypothetical protein